MTNHTQQSRLRESDVHYLEFLNRENHVRHHYYDEEMKQYELLKIGNPDAVTEGMRLFSSQYLGHLSDDPLRNIKYMFVASVTLATRFAIEGGMSSETAYDISDLYIRKADKCSNPDDVVSLHTEMLTFFTQKIIRIRKQNIISKNILQCMDYIDYHLHEKITVLALADYVKLNPSYLSVLFHKETGLPISSYIAKRRIETAGNMLKFSDYSYADISSFLAFSSQSHFIKIFRKETGYTPKEYRNLFFRSDFTKPSPI